MEDETSVAGSGTGKLAGALSKARAEFKPIQKGRTAKIESSKGGYSYQYADLSDVLDAVIPALSKNGLAVSQTTALAEGGMVLLTRLMHDSGQAIMGEYPLPKPQDVRAQEMGSALTYGRRYSICALLAIAAEDDDDGAAANEVKTLEHRISKGGGPERVTEGAVPACPRCKSTRTMRSKFPGPDFFCNACKKAFGIVDVEPGVEEAAAAFE